MKLVLPAFLTLPLLWLVAGLAWADLPRMEDPSRGKGRSAIETIRNYAYDVVILLALGICAAAFLVVANSCIATYSEIHEGRKRWKDLGAVAGVGVMLLVIIIWLLTQATDIL